VIRESQHTIDPNCARRTSRRGCPRHGRWHLGNWVFLPPLAAVLIAASCLPWQGKADRLAAADVTAALPCDGVAGGESVRPQAPCEPEAIRLCQGLGPAAPCCVRAVDGSTCNPCRGWEAARAIMWQAYAQGEYVGHERAPHVDEYRLRVDDQLELVYRSTRDVIPSDYRLNVGDEVRIESLVDAKVDRERVIVQPDGKITVRLLEQIPAAGRTVTQLRDDLEEKYKKFYNVPAITVTPLKMNTKLQDLLTRSTAATVRAARIGRPRSRPRGPSPCPWSGRSTSRG
jgi:polysaccharide export outer membrane protein